jgi:phosphatidate cytidylyltransferase
MTPAGSPATGVVGSATASRSLAGELRTRMLTALVLMPLFLAVAVVGRELFLGTMLLLTGAGAWEFLTMASLKPIPVRRLAGVGLALAFPALLYWSDSSAIFVTLLTAAVAGVALNQLVTGGARESIPAVSVTLFAAAYVGLLFGHFVLVREIAREMPGAPYWFGAAFLAIPLGLTWTNDTAAYVIGKRWGRRRLAPEISPGKSLEGALGALLVTVGVAVPLLWMVDRWVGVFTAADGFALGVLVGVAAPCGDLVESSFKRDAGVKDVSRLIPGHGGVLDRFDSLLFAVPVFYYYVREVVL